MNGAWKWCVGCAIVYGMMNGKGAELCSAVMDSGDEALRLTMILLSAMTVWSGLMEILSSSGDMTRLGRIVRRVAAPVFGGLKDEECWEAMGTNLAANMLGMGNAATPAGIRAAKLLASRGAEGMRALAALLVINNAGLQLMPTTVIAMRQAAGSADAGSVWLPSLAASAASLVTGLAALRLSGRAGRTRA